jgi:prolyl-tRNA editing enzyme YbaK/EbsC (Cys-tRNA(Pro) deacylase)
LSGYEHNAVTPIGFACAAVPIIIDQRIVNSLEWIWLGGGEVDVKWAISVSDLLNHFNAFVGLVTSDPSD